VLSGALNPTDCAVSSRSQRGFQPLLSTGAGVSVAPHIYFRAVGALLMVSSACGTVGDGLAIRVEKLDNSNQSTKPLLAGGTL
jgi:hypothetical protein